MLFQARDMIHQSRSVVKDYFENSLLRKGKRPIGDRTFSGAGNEARTRYLHLGKVALYRMSYARMWRRHPDLNRRIGDLQSPALPLGYGAEKKLVPGVGIEPTTRGFSVRCSTN